MLQDITIWAGAKSKDDIISNDDLYIMPLNKNIADGIIERARALKTLFLRQQTIHIVRYKTISKVSNKR